MGECWRHHRQTLEDLWPLQGVWLRTEVDPGWCASPPQKSSKIDQRWPQYYIIDISLVFSSSLFLVKKLTDYIENGVFIHSSNTELGNFFSHTRQLWPALLFTLPCITFVWRNLTGTLHTLAYTFSWIGLPFFLWENEGNSNLSFFTVYARWNLAIWHSVFTQRLCRFFF